MVTCGGSYRVFNPETQQWVRFSNYSEADQAEAGWLFGKAAQAVNSGRQTILLGSQVKRMKQAGMLSRAGVASPSSTSPVVSK